MILTGRLARELVERASRLGRVNPAEALGVARRMLLRDFAATPEATGWRLLVVEPDGSETLVDEKTDARAAAARAS